MLKPRRKKFGAPVENPYEKEEERLEELQQTAKKTNRVIITATQKLDSKAEVLKNVKKSGKLKRGRKELIAYLEQGKTPSPKGAILAQCYLCMGMYDGGSDDCESPVCPLYPHMPYNLNRGKTRTSTGKPRGFKKT